MICPDCHHELCKAQEEDRQHDLEAALRDRDTMAETLTIAQARGTELVEEVRLLKARLARYGA